MNLCNNTEEQFKPIKGYEGLYEAGDLGSIKNTKTNRILKLTINSKGYNNVGLYRNNKNSTKKIHRLVAQAFIKNLENKPQVNHINGIKIDNRIDNLEWATAKENMNHAIKTGLWKSTPNRAKQTIDLYTGIVYNSLKNACESLNLNYNLQKGRINDKINIRLQYV